MRVVGGFCLVSRSNGARAELSRAVDRVCCESHGESCFCLTVGVNELAMSHVRIAGYMHFSSHQALSIVRYVSQEGNAAFDRAMRLFLPGPFLLSTCAMTYHSSEVPR